MTDTSELRTRAFVVFKSGLMAAAKQMTDAATELDALRAEVERLEKENANLHDCYEYTKAGDNFQATAITLLAHMSQHIDDQGKFLGTGHWRLNEVASAIMALRKADQERLASAATSEEKRPLLIADNERLTAENAKLRELVESVTDGLDDYWVTIEPGLSWLDKRNNILNPEVSGD